MQQVRVGSSGLVVSRRCLGTGSFGGATPEDQAHAVLDAALERGITTIDTADVYPHASTNGSIGRTEALIGRWMTGRRDQVVIATKGSYPTGPRAWHRGNGRRHLREAVEASLRRLDTDLIDAPTRAADQECRTMAVMRMPAGEESLCLTQLVNEALLHQKVERAIGDRRLPGNTVGFQLLQHIVGTQWPICFEENFQRMAAVGSHALAARCA